MRIKFWSGERNTGNTENKISDLYFNEERDYSEEDTCDNKVFRSTILQQFQFKLEKVFTCGKERYENETKHIHASAANLLHIRIGNLDWCKLQKQSPGCVL